MATPPDVSRSSESGSAAPHSRVIPLTPEQRSGRLGAPGWWAVLLFAACDAAGNAPVLDLPPRLDGAPGGAEIARDIRTLDLQAREERIYSEIARGNVPPWLRRLERVEMTSELDGLEHRVTFWVAPDYLTVGSAQDFLHVPLSPRTAQRVADLVGGTLPTPRMVDAIWASARVRLAPIRIPPDEFMTTVEYFVHHDRLVGTQRWLRGVPPGVFVAGHKVDLVLPTPRSADSASGAIYGWHRPGGRPIQPLYILEGNGRVIYNRGVRLVHRDILVDGVRRNLLDALRDPELASLLTGGRASGGEGRGMRRVRRGG